MKGVIQTLFRVAFAETPTNFRLSAKTVKDPVGFIENLNLTIGTLSTKPSMT